MASDSGLQAVEQLVRDVRVPELREHLERILRRWNTKEVKETLALIRETVETALDRLVKSLSCVASWKREPDEDGPASVAVPPDIADAAADWEGSLRVIKWLEKTGKVVPASVALHLRTLSAWGNYGHHGPTLKGGRRVHRADDFDLAALIVIVLRLEDWIATRREGKPGILGEAEWDYVAAARRILAQAERAGLGGEMLTSFAQAAGSSLVHEPHRLFAPRLSMDLIWGAPEAAPDVLGPYRGLLPFGLEDAGRFFGRDKLRESILKTVTAERLTIVSGASGAGKTSVLRAGVLPALIDRGQRALVLAEYSKEAIDAARRIVETVPSGFPLVVILDQLERALLPEVGPDQRQALFDFVALAGGCSDATGRSEATPDAAANVRLVLCLREDFLGLLFREAQALADARVSDALHRKEAFVPVGPLGPAEAREAVVRPLEGAGVSFEDSLLRDDLLPALRESGGIGTAPVRLQIVCSRLLEEARAANLTLIDRDLYRRLGGATRILGGYLDDVLSAERYEGLQDLARSLLKVMVGTEARRWVDHETLWREGMEPTGLTTDEVEVESVLRRLTEDRLIVSWAPRDAVLAREYTLMHDQLAAAVRNWMTPLELERREAQDVLDRAVAAWPDRSRREVLRGRGLKLVEKHFARLRREQPELAAQILRRSRTVGRLRLAGIATLVAVAAVGLLVGGYGLRWGVASWQEEIRKERAARENEAKQVEHQRSRANSAEAEADRLVLVHARSMLDSDPSASATAQRELRLPDSAVQGWRILCEARKRGLGRSLAHEVGVGAVAFGPGARTLASGTDDGAVHFWDVRTGTLVAETDYQHGGFVASLAFSSDGTQLASGGSDSDKRIWLWAVGAAPVGMRIGVVRGPLKGHEGSVDCLAFSPDGSTLVSGGADGLLLAWDASTGRSRRLGDDLGRLTSVRFSADGRYLAAAGCDERLRVWDLVTDRLQLEQHFPRGCAASVDSPSTMDWVGWLASGGDLDVRNAARQRALTSAVLSRSGYPTPTGQSVIAGVVADVPPLFAVAWPDAEGILVAVATLMGRGPLYVGWREGLGRWAPAALPTDVDAPRPLSGSSPARLLGHTGAIQALTLSQDGGLLATGSTDKTVRIWNLEAARLRDVASRLVEGCGPTWGPLPVERQVMMRMPDGRQTPFTLPRPDALDILRRQIDALTSLQAPTDGGGPPP